MRPDKVTLAAVAATLGLYRAGRAAAEVPVWRMIAASADGLRLRAEALALGLPGAEAIPTEATIGGGSLPGEVLPSVGIAIAAGQADRLLGALRRGVPAVVARIQDGRVILDLRTVDPDDDASLGRAIASAISETFGKAIRR
jgi:L-seryl-tRNA(Ser) seleniumtransferase